MKLHYALTMAAAILITQPAQAGRHHQQHMLQHLTSELNLSAEQVETVRGILDEASAEREAHKQAMHEEMQVFHCAQREQTHESLSQVLDADQLAALEQMRAERDKGDARGRRGGKHRMRFEC
ncbi:MAG: hypothetical protein DHS20C11_13940 [Lysobacteraceae bacterium]|nr:MAG: hypothetical protein DHS20C11_13940 [Xanthomonadaceae bacterium]